MKDYYRAGKNICSHLRSKGYDVKFIQNSIKDILDSIKNNFSHILNQNKNKNQLVKQDFFCYISRESFSMNIFSNLMSIPYSDPELNHNIIIGNNIYGNKRGELKDAQAFVIEEAIRKEADIAKDPSPFYRKIEGRSSTPKTIRKKKYNITGDYGVCDKYASLLEINTALDLGFNISLE